MSGIYLASSSVHEHACLNTCLADFTSLACSAYVAVHTAAFTCEAALVALTLLKLMTEAQEPRFDGSDAAAVRQFRINVGVTAVSFSFTAVAFVGTVACFSSVLARLRGAARRVSERALARLALLVHRGAGPNAGPGAVSRAEPVGRPAAPMVTSSDGKADGAAAGEVQPGVAAGPLVHESQRAGLITSPQYTCLHMCTLHETARPHPWSSRS